MLARKSFILVRHSAVVQQPSVPAREWRLSAYGRSLAAHLGLELRPHSPTRIITSEEPKARETGQIIAETLNLPWHTAPGLQEHDRDGMPYLPTREEFETAVAHFFAHTDRLVLGNETANQTLERVKTAVATQRAAYPHDTLILVSHGTVLTLFCCHHNPHLDPFTFWRSLTLPWWGVYT